MEGRLTTADLDDLLEPDDDPDDGERTERPQEARRPSPRPDRWAWLSIAPDGALRIEPMAA